MGQASLSNFQKTELSLCKIMSITYLGQTPRLFLHSVLLMLGDQRPVVMCWIIWHLKRLLGCAVLNMIFSHYYFMLSWFEWVIHNFLEGFFFFFEFNLSFYYQSNLGLVKGMKGKKEKKKGKNVFFYMGNFSKNSL